MSIFNRIKEVVKTIRFSASPRLYGRSSAGAGEGQEIVVGAGLSLTGGTLAINFETIFGNTAPTNLAFASTTFTPDGTNNDIKITAKTAGVAGNNIYVTLTVQTNYAEIYVTESLGGNETLTIGSGDKYRMQIAAFTPLTPNAVGDLIFAGYDNGDPQLPIWTSNGSLTPAVSGYWYKLYFPELAPSAGWWTIQVFQDGVELDARWQSPYIVEGAGDTWPDEYSFSASTGVSGVPTVTAAPATANQLIALINSLEDILIEASNADGSNGTGSIDGGGGRFLTGGTVATVTPPYIRVASGFLYIQENGIWKKIALTNL